jgi:hypothetical protein
VLVHVDADVERFHSTQENKRRRGDSDRSELAGMNLHLQDRSIHGSTHDATVNLRFDHLDLCRCGGHSRLGFIDPSLRDFYRRAATGEIFRADGALVRKVLGKPQLPGHIVQERCVDFDLTSSHAQIGLARAEVGAPLATIEAEQGIAGFDRSDALLLATGKRYRPWGRASQ